jgi:hypothetical protein
MSAKRTENPQAFIMARKMSGFANLLLGAFRDGMRGHAASR